jgi:SAM-dependent methyltransferase
MDNVLAGLNENQRVLDLGCGGGSFRYESYKFQAVGIDLTPSAQVRHSHLSFVQADSTKIPLAGNSIDAVLCNHTMEHFIDFKETLAEINRVLKDDGFIWIAIPNGYSFDDGLYRRLFSGGGHVNRFTHDEFIAEVHRLTRFRLVDEVDLFSSFIYLKKPAPELRKYHSRRARLFFCIPDAIVSGGILFLNAATRMIDKVFRSQWSRYGWGFLFAPPGSTLPRLHHPYFNVCSQCGAGIPVSELRGKGKLKQWLGFGVFHCPQCSQLNAFIAPPPGCE